MMAFDRRFNTAPRLYSRAGATIWIDMIKDRPAHLLADKDYATCPKLPYLLDWEPVPDLIRRSIADLGGVQPITGAMAKAAGGTLNGGFWEATSPAEGRQWAHIRREPHHSSYKIPIDSLFALCSKYRMRHEPQSAPGAPPPAFTPVPVRPRRDGWTPDRQRAFIAALADTLCVERAVAAAGMSRESAYRLRRRPQARSFAAAWDEIMARRVRMPPYPSLLWHRAFYGTIKPIVRGGQVVGTLHRPDNQAAMSLLHRMDQADRAGARIRARRDRGESSQ